MKRYRCQKAETVRTSNSHLMYSTYAQWGIEPLSGGEANEKEAKGRTRRWYRDTELLSDIKNINVIGISMKNNA